MKAIFESILNGWVKATREPCTGHPISNLFKKDLKDEVENILQDIGVNYVVKASIGAGNWASVPWLSMLDPRITSSTQDGVYPVYLFRGDGSGFYLSLEFGSTELKKKFGAIGARNQAKIIAEKIRSFSPAIKLWGSDEIDLRSGTELGKSYEWASAGAIFYPADKVPDDGVLSGDLIKLVEIYKSLPDDIMVRVEGDTKSLNGSRNFEIFSIPKPFILLAGISGTGKTRFVREQAGMVSGDVEKPENYELVAVRPDWHEPSDLLGYVSRIGNAGPHYVVTDVLRFMVKAWKAAVDDNAVLQPIDDITPYWLCLDEMNLAPVEQYFADYLSVLETRNWKEGVYSCGVILKLDALREQLGEAGVARLRKDLGMMVDDAASDALWHFFESKKGIPLPPNLIVAGTVNMDETTHGFSRKVIDRAFTIDFGEFFPNDYADFFEPKTQAKQLKFPVLSQALPADLDGTFDSDGAKSVAFLSALNGLLKQTPFELAYRALNELLLAVACFKPVDNMQLQAVWDDFLMTKVLPRIEGDADKLRRKENGPEGDDLLMQLQKLLALQLSVIWSVQRPDLLRADKNNQDPLMVETRSKKKLAWMQQRLDSANFTAFWP